MLGLLVASLAYLKVTYFAFALVIIAFGIILKQISVQVIYYAVAVVLTIAVVIELLFHNNLPYINDVFYAISVKGDSDTVWRLKKLWRIISIAMIYCGLIIGITIMMKPLWSPKLWLNFWWRPALVAFVAILSGIGVAYQNHATRETNMDVVGLILFAELARRAMAKQEVTDAGLCDESRGRVSVWLGRLSPRLAVASIIGAAGIFSALDASSIVRATVATLDGTGCPVSGLKGTPLSKFMQTPSAMAGTNRKLDPMSHTESAALHCATTQNATAALSRPDVNYYHVEGPLLNDAMPLLRRALKKSDRLLVLDFASPYSAAFELQPPRHDVAWWSEGRTVSRANFPPVTLLFGPTTVVLQRKGQDDTILWVIFGRYIQTHYDVVGETRWWRVWRRRAVPLQSN